MLAGSNSHLRDLDVVKLIRHVPQVAKSNQPIAKMTTSSHNWSMKQVRIADLKARLSEYLRAVRAGESIAVLDRDTPVAQLIPVRESRALRVQKPAPGSPPPNRIKVPKRTRLNVDIVALLLEERQGHR